MPKPPPSASRPCQPAQPPAAEIATRGRTWPPRAPGVSPNSESSGRSVPCARRTPGRIAASEQNATDLRTNSDNDISLHIFNKPYTLVYVYFPNRPFSEGKFLNLFRHGHRNAGRDRSRNGASRNGGSRRNTR